MELPLVPSLRSLIKVPRVSRSRVAALTNLELPQSIKDMLQRPDTYVDEINAYLKTVKLPVTSISIIVPEGYIDRLLTMTYKNGNPIFTLENREVLYEVVNALGEVPVETMIDYLKDVEDPNSLILGLPTLAGVRQRARFVQIITRLEGDVGAGGEPCPRCKSTRTRFELVQLRSADEMQSVLHRCVTCLFEWRSH